MIYYSWKWTLTPDWFGLNPDPVYQLNLIWMIWTWLIKPVKKGRIVQSPWLVMRCSTFAAAVVVRLLCSNVTRMRFRVVNARERSRADDCSWRRTITTTNQINRTIFFKNYFLEDCMQPTTDDRTLYLWIGNHFPLKFIATFNSRQFDWEISGGLKWNGCRRLTLQQDKTVTIYLQSFPQWFPLVAM